jgi:glycosyltransferase involved in cell wall biosynthesis
MSMKPRIYFLFHGRFPSEKAAALYVSEYARSLTPYAHVTILAPARRGRTDTFSIPEGITVSYLPAIDLFPLPGAFLASQATFAISAWTRVLSKLTQDDLVIANDLPLGLLATRSRARVVYEVHDFPERWLSFYRALFERAAFIMATNEWKKRELMERYRLPEGKVLMERNGVDLASFAGHERQAARSALALPEGPLVVYTGHLYGWKGTDTLAEAARLVPSAQFYFVGGTQEDVADYRKRYADAPNCHFVGHRPHAEIPQWQAAADVLVLPNTAREPLSARYTSPMKLFEYLASGTAVVASRIPSITEVVSEESAYLVAPDAPEALAAGINEPLAHAEEREKRAHAARALAASFSWEARAKRLVAAFSRG